MSTFVDDFEDMRICPYNNLHHVTARRYLDHINRCEKTYRGPPIVKCPFDTSHRIPEAELDEHVAECSSGFQAIRRAIHQSQKPPEFEERENPQPAEPSASSNRLGRRTYITPLSGDIKIDVSKITAPLDHFAISRLSKSEKRLYQQRLVELTRMRAEQGDTGLPEETFEPPRPSCNGGLGSWD